MKCANMKNKYEFELCLAAVCRGTEDVTGWISSLRTLGGEVGGSIKYMWKIVLGWQADGQERVLVIYLYSAFL